MKQFFENIEDVDSLLRYGLLSFHTLKNKGILLGGLGMVSLFYEYARYAKDDLYNQFADDLLESMQDFPIDLPLSLNDGLIGVACAYVYLSKHGFIQGDIDDILLDVDKEIVRRSSQHLVQVSLFDDIEFYRNYRLNYSEVYDCLLLNKISQLFLTND